MLKWCFEQGPEVCCPTCRGKLFNTEGTIDWLKYGVQGKAYEHDARYDAWENFTRSYADLDKHLAENNSTEVTLHSDVAISTWTVLVDGELLESQESTPHHLQPARAPEYGLLVATVRSSQESLDSVTLPTRAIHNTTPNDVRRAFGRALLRGGRAQTLDRQHQLVLLALTSDNEIRLGLRYGFIEFVKRTHSRMLQFLHLRVCDCNGGHGSFHQHGLRAYYSLAKPEEQEMEGGE